MTTPELITDEIVNKAWATASYYQQCSSLTNDEIMRKVILSIQDDITRPLYKLMQSYKRDAEAYERALKEIRQRVNDFCISNTICSQIADKSLKGEYHKTDFTEYCEQNPITEK